MRGGDQHGKKQFSDVASERRRDCLIELTLYHPVNAHGITCVSSGAVAPSADLDIGRVLIQLAVVMLALIVSEHQRMRAVSGFRQWEVSLEQPMTNYPQTREHRPA